MRRDYQQLEEASVGGSGGTNEIDFEMEMEK